MHDEYFYLKYGSNIFRIKKMVLKGTSVDFSKFLEIMVYDGENKFHFEKNKSSVLLAEQKDVKALEMTDDPYEREFVVEQYEKPKALSASKANIKQQILFAKRILVVPSNKKEVTYQKAPLPVKI